MSAPTSRLLWTIDSQIYVGTDALVCPLAAAFAPTAFPERPADLENCRFDRDERFPALKGLGLSRGRMGYVPRDAKAEPATEMPRSLPQEHRIPRAKTARPKDEPPHHMLFPPKRRKKVVTRS